MPANTVNPSLLTSLPSPSTSYDRSPSPSTDGPPRKRSRSEMSSEERKEARAHRNRIAAQNSRDRRKAHYTQLEQRVAELEEENRRLRAGHFDVPAPTRRSPADEQERDKARDRENEELKERIKTLEKGWGAVVKALAAQGLPTGIPASPPAETLAQHQSSSTFPVIVPNTTSFPISPAPSNTSLSASSFDFEFDVAESESTRQLARLATTEAIPPSVPQQRETETISDAAMEDLFREILAPSPTSPTSSLPLDSSSSSEFQISSTPASSTPAQMMMTESSTVDWENEEEMQRLLAMLPNVQSSMDGTTSSAHALAPLDFDVESEWDMERASNPILMGTGIGVF